jgi:hypothetical protein
MPELTTIFCYTCPSNEYWQKEVVGSKGDKYMVTYTGRQGWHCTCPAFKFRGNCKHIKQVEKDRCGWNWEAYCGDTGTPEPDPKKPGGFGLCPMCHEPVEIVKVGV